jgi:hypothetical protein
MPSTVKPSSSGCASPCLPGRVDVCHGGALRHVQVQDNSGDGTNQCISAIIPGGDTDSVILGDNFMRSWYTVYTYDLQSRTAYVGYAQSNSMTSR